MSRDALIEMIDEAKQARHRIAIGGLMSFTTTNGEQYNKQSLGALTTYIRSLELELAALPDPNGGGGYGFHAMTVEGAH